MSVSDILISLRSGREHGEFQFTKGEALREAVRREKVPQKFGVYLVSVSRDSGFELVYIGKAGTLLQNGNFGAQTLAGRLVNKQDGKPRAQFFAEKMAEEQISRLQIEWVVTADDAPAPIPPFFAEAQLLNAYHTERGCLPRWNKNA